MGICHSTEPHPTPSETSSTTSLPIIRTRTDSFKFDSSGRRLHADVTPLSEDSVQSEKLYVLPNDDEEMDRLHLQHYMIRLLWKGNFSAPVEVVLRGEGSRCLDLGCGSGIWCMEMATDFPTIHFTGLDMSPVQPGNIKPRNVDFMTGDLTKLPLPFGDGTFDFVHMRLLLLGLRAEFWPTLIAEVVRITKPGGWVEFMEPRGIALEGRTKTMNLMGLALQAAASRGIDLDIANHLKPHLQAIPHLMNITNLTRDLHTCPDPSDGEGVRLARLLGEDLFTGLMGLKAGLVARGVCREEEYVGLLKAHVEEMLSTKHTITWTRCFARRRV
ncbi:hypothetical protein HDV00_002745 [Rhizophlyctis rosea]|nr:hypothetical protein HDV00_002745 [Rhizophlyctis rosea]